jgi:hypothetical protein
MFPRFSTLWGLNLTVEEVSIDMCVENEGGLFWVQRQHRQVHISFLCALNMRYVPLSMPAHFFAPCGM